MENNIPNKTPNNFKEAALSHIPFELFQSMEKHATVSAADMKALHDTVMKQGPALHAAVPGAQVAPVAPVAKPTLPAQPAFMSYAIKGHVITIPTDEVGHAIMMFYTLLALVWSADKKVAKILKQFEFKFYDVNRKQIYPKVTKHA